MKVKMTAEALEGYLKHAKHAGTVEAWADVAMEWIKAAALKIKELESPE